MNLVKFGSLGRLEDPRPMPFPKNQSKNEIGSASNHVLASIYAKTGR